MNSVTRVLYIVKGLVASHMCYTMLKDG